MGVKILTRRSVSRGVGGVLAAPVISRVARAAEITWRFGHVAPHDTPLHQRLLEAAGAIAKRSDGKMELKVIGEAQAGIESGLLAQVREGGLEMTMASGTRLASSLALAAIPSIGFLFDDHAKLWPAMDGELGQSIRTGIATQVGVETLDKIWDFGFRHVTTGDRAIRNASDLTGLKIRTQADGESVDLLRSLNARPVVVTLPYLRAALEHRQLDGQEGVLPLVGYARLQGVQSYCAMTHHGWDGLWVCVNAAAWKKLPERLRGIAANAINGAASRQREDTLKQETAFRETLARSGMRFTDVDKGSFRDVLRRQGYYSRARTKFGEAAWNVLQKASGVLA